MFILNLQGCKQFIELIFIEAKIKKNKKIVNILNGVTMISETFFRYSYKSDG